MKSRRRRSKKKARPMRLGEPARMQAAINITPLVDVVLVLLIIFMVMAPQMRKGPDVNLPNTTKPNSQGDERGRILVSIDEAGGLWINDQPVAAEHFDETLRAAVGAETDVDIPRASADTSAQVAESQLILSIGAAACPILTPPAGEGIPKDCQVTLADQKISVAELPTRVAEILVRRPAEQRALFLAVDDRLNYEGVLRIIDLAKSGVEDLKIEFVAAN